MAVALRQFYPGGFVGFRQGDALTAANDLVIPAVGDSFVVAGNTQINGVSVASRPIGSKFTLHFSGTPTVKHNTAPSAGFVKLLLAGGDLTASADDNLTLEWNGTTCNQVAGAVI